MQCPFMHLVGAAPAPYRSRYGGVELRCAGLSWDEGEQVELVVPVSRRHSANSDASSRLLVADGLL